MAEGAAAIAVISTGYQMYANKKATEEKQAAAQQEANALAMQSAEMQDRYEINKLRLEKDFTKYKGDVSLSAAKAGVDIGSAPLYLLEQVNRDYQEEQYNMFRESQFKSLQMYNQGQFAQQQVGRIGALGRTQGYGIFMQGGASVANIYQAQKANNDANRRADLYARGQGG